MKLSIRLALVPLALFGFGCSTPHPLTQLGDAYLAETYRNDPMSGVGAGRHEYDGRGGDVSAAAIRLHIANLHELREKLEPYAKSPEVLTARRARELLVAVDTELFWLERVRRQEIDPQTYAIGAGVDIYAKRDFAPLEDRAESTIKLLGSFPGVFAAGKANLQPQLAKSYLEAAIENGQGQRDFLRTDLITAFAAVDNPDVQRRLKSAAATAAQGCDDFATFLKSRLASAHQNFAIGRFRYVEMLRDTELIEESPEQILALGMAELDRQKQALLAAAREIDASRDPMTVWEGVLNEHPTAAGLVPDTRKHLEAIRQFMIDREIITFPSERRVRVEETPAFERAGTFASMDTPGPFETKSTESFYYVTPVEPTWDAARQNEHLTGFNFYTSDIVSIHEAYPGHFVQSLALHASDAASAWRSIGSYAFVEGWAHYCEQMACDEGFPPAELRTDPKAVAKYRMAQASEALLRCCRLICSIRMHTQGMTEAQAQAFFEQNSFYKPEPARREAQRGTYDPGYCFYTIGKLQFLKLRADWQKQEGAAFTLKRFHDECLRHGQPPLRILREYMLKDPTLWDKTL